MEELLIKAKRENNTKVVEWLMKNGAKLPVSPEPKTNKYNENGKKEGIWQFWDSEDELTHEGNYVNGKRQSLWKGWYESGTVQHAYEGNWANGKQGLWKYWYPNGQLNHEENYTNGRLHGLWKYWNENGTLICEGIHVNGEKEGLWKEWWSDGTVKCEQYYKNGAEVSVDVYVNGETPSPEPKSVNQLNPENGEREGLWESYYEGGVQLEYRGSYINGMPDGVWSNWDKHGELRYETYYKDGFRVSKKEFFLEEPETIPEPPKKVNQIDENGNKHGLWEMHYLNGKPESLWKGWYEGGKLIYEKYYENGQLKYQRTINQLNENGNKEGLWKERYVTGPFPSSETNWVNGIRQGLYKSWFENGVQSSEGYYVDGKHNGFWKFWYPNGNKCREENYVSGIKEGLCKIWCEDGRKDTEGNYVNGTKQGLWKEFCFDETSWYEGNFVNDDYDGVWNVYYSSDDSLEFYRYYKDGKEYLEAPVKTTEPETIPEPDFENILNIEEMLNVVESEINKKVPDLSKSLIGFIKGIIDDSK